MAPPSVKLIPEFEHDPHSSFWSLASLAFPDVRAKYLTSAGVETLPAPLSGAVALPDEQMLCYDYLYYTSADAVRTFNQCGNPSLDGSLVIAQAVLC